MEASASAPVRPVVQGLVGPTILARRRDEHLAKLIADGNQQAFETLYGRYNQQLYRYCRSIVHDDSDAQDALQSTMTAALTALRESRRRAPVRPWLYRIAHNESITVLRKRSHTAEEASEQDAGLSATTEERAGERARFALLMSDLGELPERQRSALLMRELNGLSHGEIALALQTSEGAAKQAIFDARKALAEFQEGRAMECERVQRVVSDGDGRAMRRRSVRAHLRDCVACKAFEATITTRTAELDAIVPVMAAPVATALLARVLAGGAAHGGVAAGMAGAGAAGGSVGTGIAGSGIGGAGAAAGTEGGGTLIALGAAKTAASAIAAKVLAAVAVLAVAGGAVVGVRDLVGTGGETAVKHVARPLGDRVVLRVQTKLKVPAGFDKHGAAAHGAAYSAVAGHPAITQSDHSVSGTTSGTAGGVQAIRPASTSAPGTTAAPPVTQTTAPTTTTHTTTTTTHTTTSTTPTSTSSGSTRHKKGKAVGQVPGHDPGHDKVTTPSSNPPSATGKGATKTAAPTATAGSSKRTK